MAHNYKIWSTKHMLLRSLMVLTDNRKRMLLLTFLSFVTLC